MKPIKLSRKPKADDLELAIEPAKLAKFSDEMGLWYESPQEIESKEQQTIDRALLLKWVRREMRRRLTPRERRFIEMHYFRAVVMEEVGRHHGVNKSTVSRTIQRAIRKLKQAAEEAAQGLGTDEDVLRAIKNRR